MFGKRKIRLMKHYHLHLSIIFSLWSVILFSQKKIIIEGAVFDEFGTEIPYAAVGIIKKNIGTTTTAEGSFYLLVTPQELQDTLEISSIGFSTLKINIQDFITKEDKKVVLEEKQTVLSEVVVSAPIFYVKNALKRLKDNTLSKNHQLRMLYRRWSVEENVCRFYIEHYLEVLDRGPSSYILNYNIKHERRSADYRYIKNQQKIHAVKYMSYNNPLRKGIAFKSYQWKKKEASNYDDEDIIVVEGINKNSDRLTLYIGLDSYRIYKIESSKNPDIGNLLESTYIYKKNSAGKLYLSYHFREWKGSDKLSYALKQTLKSTGKPVPNFIPIAYRHEAFVLGVEEIRSKFSSFGTEEDIDMTIHKIRYDSDFWNTISLPPETTFFKKNSKELESLYGVPIEIQFKYSNP